MGAGRELFGLRKDGSEFPLEIGLNPLQTERGLEVLSSVVDITARKRLEDRFRLVVEATPNAVVVTNQQGIIELVNSQTEALFAYSRDELLGQSIEILVPHKARQHHQQVRRDYLAAPQPRAMGAGRDLFALRKDGSEFPVEIGLSPISSESGSLVLSSIIDISARKQAESQLQQQAEELATASRYKSEFLANMSHELRTPLNSILILSEQLRDNHPGNLTPRQREHADIIYRSGCDLLGLINDILDLSKIEAGRVSVCHEPIVLDDLCDNVRRIFAPIAEQKRLQFEVETAAGVPQVVISDYQRLFQILKNLISNALKFTQQGHVQVLFQVARNADSDDVADWLQISVVDSGPGIPADKHELIFQAFQQVDGSTSRQYGGTGLGLTISRQLAILLGGQIELQSAPGQGSHFILRLPLVAVPHGGSVRSVNSPLPRTAPVATTQDVSAQTGPQPATAGSTRDETILLVDDDVRNIYAMTSLLETLGFEVAIARNGEDAISLLSAREDIDLVLMDMMMPVLDGYQATSRLREQWQFSRPIIAVTACAMKGDREKCLAAGADDYLPKPVQRGELEAMIRKWLD
jgi:PAS domain S-box-containing protein